jgi:hypothetical protein
MSSDHHSRQTYAVRWGELGRAKFVGKLRIDDDALQLEGAGPEGSRPQLRLRFDELVEARIGRSPAERLNDQPALILERRNNAPLQIGDLEGRGAPIELTDAIAELASAHRPALRHVSIVVPIKADAREQVRRLIQAGPPFDPSLLPLERHHVFLGDREVVFVFESPNIRGLIVRLIQHPQLWNAASAWKEHLSGRPRIAEEEYEWSRASPD